MRRTVVVNARFSLAIFNIPFASATQVARAGSKAVVDVVTRGRVALYDASAAAMAVTISGESGAILEP
jgi:hypothetical protein